MAGNIIVEGVQGKRCPDGHFNTLYELKKGRRIERRVKPVIDTPPVGTDENHVADITQRTAEARRELRKLKLGREAELEIALRSVVSAYDQLLKTIKPSTAATTLVEGTLQPYINLAKKVLA